MGISCLWGIYFFCVIFSSMSYAGATSISTNHKIQNDLRFGDVVHVITRFNGDYDIDLSFQFNIDEAGCSISPKRVAVENYPFAGSSSSSNYIESDMEVHRVLSLASYGLAWPCRNLKMFVIDKKAKNILSTYSVKGDSSIGHNLLEKFFVSEVVGGGVRVEFVLSNDARNDFLIDDLGVEINCSGGADSGSLLYNIEIGDKHLKPLSSFYYAREYLIDGDRVDIRSCSSSLRYVLKSNLKKVARTLHMERINKITSREHIKLY